MDSESVEGLLSEFSKRDVRLNRCITIRVTKRELALVQKVSKLRGTDASGFARFMIRRGLAELGFLDEEEEKALGLTGRPYG